MYSINKILSAMGQETLAGLETMDRNSGIDLIELEKIGTMQVYYLTLLFFPKSIIYRDDIEYVESIFEMCGKKTVEAYINLLKYYSSVVKLDNNTYTSFNISIYIDFFSNSKDITALISAENGKLHLHSIKLPLSALGDRTILMYAASPATLMNDVLEKSNIRIYTGHIDTQNDSTGVNTVFNSFIMDFKDINKYHHYLNNNAEIGDYYIGTDIACFNISNNISVIYVKNDVLYSYKTSIDTLCDRYQTDIDMLYIMYKDICINNKNKQSISGFLETLRGYVTPFISSDINKYIRESAKSHNDSDTFFNNISGKSTIVDVEKLYDYLVDEQQ